MAVDQATRHEPVRGLPNAPVRMIRGNLDDVPQHDVPSGYSIRWYEPGDDLHWRRIHVECEGYEDISRTLFADEFGDDQEALRQRMGFICRADGLPVATNAAWFGEFKGRIWGRIHWVATSRKEQSAGISKPLMTTVCNRLLDLGHENAYLTTNSRRLRAILFYHGFGFRPDWNTKEEEETWRVVSEKATEAGRRIEL